MSPAPKRHYAHTHPEEHREIVKRAGQAAHRKGTAHEWTSEEAREAGRKGGRAKAQQRRAPREDSAA